MEAIQREMFYTSQTEPFGFGPSRSFRLNLLDLATWGSSHPCRFIFFKKKESNNLSIPPAWTLYDDELLTVQRRNPCLAS